MPRITTFLKGLTRRLKRMGEFGSTTGVLLIPFGFWLIVQYPDSKWMGAIAVGLGLFCWFTSYWIIRGREKREREDKIQTLELKYLEAKDNERKFNAIIEELKALNTALSKDRGGTE